MQIPKDGPGAIKLGTDNVKGMQTYGSTLGITLVTLAECEGNLAAFIAQDGSYNAGRSAQQTASNNYQTALEPIYPWLLGVSNTLATIFGTRWNTEWAQAGFINKTTQIPTRNDDRSALLVALASFYTANPSREVASLNQTAAFATNLRNAAVTAQQALTVATINFNNVSKTWTDAYNTLADGMRALERNLASVLDNDDPRWLSFGFTMPGTSSTPGKPQNVTAQLDQFGNIIVQCDPESYATRYRFRRMIVGVEASYVLADSSKEPIGSIADILPGQTVQIIVQAVNGNLQGVASDPIVFTIPPVVNKKVEASEAVTSHRDVATTNNGHANGSRQTSLA